MTDNGELKKQIKQASWIDGEFRVANYDTFRTVLDAAKKDLYEPINRLENLTDPVGNDYAYTYQRLVERIKKWFGDVNK